MWGIREGGTSLPSRAFGGSLISEEHCDVSPPKVTSFETLGRPNTSDETSTSKRASKVHLGDRTDSPALDINMGVVLVGLRIGQLKMDMV